jgi:hypothetical protein
MLCPLTFGGHLGEPVSSHESVLLESTVFFQNTKIFCNSETTQGRDEKICFVQSLRLGHSGHLNPNNVFGLWSF